MRMRSSLFTGGTYWGGGGVCSRCALTDNWFQVNARETRDEEVNRHWAQRLRLIGSVFPLTPHHPSIDCAAKTTTVPFIHPMLSVGAGTGSFLDHRRAHASTYGQETSFTKLKNKCYCLAEENTITVYIPPCLQQELIHVPPL